MELFNYLLAFVMVHFHIRIEVEVSTDEKTYSHIININNDTNDGKLYLDHWEGLNNSDPYHQAHSLSVAWVKVVKLAKPVFKMYELFIEMYTEYLTDLVEHSDEYFTYTDNSK